MTVNMIHLSILPVAAAVAALRGAPSTLMECLTLMQKREKRTRERSWKKEEILQARATLDHKQRAWQANIVEARRRIERMGGNGERSKNPIRKRRGRQRCSRHNGSSQAANTNADSSCPTGPTIKDFPPFTVPEKLHGGSSLHPSLYIWHYRLHSNPHHHILQTTTTSHTLISESHGWGMCSQNGPHFCIEMDRAVCCLSKCKATFSLFVHEICIVLSFFICTLFFPHCFYQSLKFFENKFICISSPYILQNI